MDKITKIYLVTNCYGDPFKVYIGKEKSNKNTKRENDHKKKYGKHIIFTYIDEIESWERENWKLLETYWIQQFIAWGFEVMNIRKTGGGGPEFQTEKVKRKIGSANKGNKNLLGFKYSEEMKNKMRKPKSEEHKNKISISNTGKIRTKEVIQKLRKPHIEGTGEKISISSSKFPVLCLENNKIFRNVEIASKEMKISPTLIRKVCDNTSLKAKGYTFKYIK